MGKSTSLKGIKIEGYKCLRDVDIEFRDLNVLIGPNGSGKSSFFEVLTLLRDSAKGSLEQTITDRGGISNLVYRGDSGKIGLTVKFKVSEKKSDVAVGYGTFYGLLIVRRGFSYEIDSEKMFYEIGSNERSAIDLTKYISTEKKSETGLSMISETSDLSDDPETRKIFDDSVLATKRWLESVRVYSLLSSFVDEYLSKPQTLSIASLPSQDGKNLISAIYNMRTKKYDSYERLIDVLKTAFPDFERLEFPIVGAGQATLAWHLKSFEEPIYPNQLSEGMRRFLFLSAILLSPELPSITVIDDPETGLHPELLKLLAGLMKDASLRTKLFVATQSAELVRWLEPKDVLVVDRNDDEGTASFRRADDFNLDKWLKEYTLGDLWLMGEIGGRP